MNIYELIYIGKGKGTIIGVPARNLTELDIDAISMLYTVDELCKTGLYERTDKPEIIIIEEDKPKRKRVIKESE